MPKKIFISGMHSGQNPCAGVGIARSLKKAFPQLELVGVDHWHGSSGLHHEVLSDVLILPQWKQINTQRHRDMIMEFLDEGHLWIPALDVEVYWLAQNFGEHRNLLAPSGRALELTAKPEVKGFDSIGLKVPDCISAFSSDNEIHSFLRKNSWQCWLKGPYHDAKRINSWASFEKAREAMGKSWKTNRLFLQKHVFGQEESFCFSAYEGKLLSLIHMQKRLITSEGKTWAGQVTPIQGEFFEKFSEAIHELNWSGGGEIEFTQDPDGNKWVIECNPRFPAWIFGAALNGANLPAKIISEIWKLPFAESNRKFKGFTRVVQEIPAQESVGLPIPQDPSLTGWKAEEGKGKGVSSVASSIPNLRDSMSYDPNIHELEIKDKELPPIPQHLPENYLEEIRAQVQSYRGDTPARIHLRDWTFSRFQSLVREIKNSQPHPAIRIGYSVKTSATDQHMKYARECGFLTECISQMEVHRALKLGVPANEIILNGPGKFWPLTSPPVEGLHMIFCDSLEEFDRVIQLKNISKVLGFRIQIPKLSSRFGVPVEKIENFKGIVKRVKSLKNQFELGFHFHMPSWAIGVNRWKEAFRSLLTWCQAIEQLTEVPILHLDLGGGFFPSDLEKMNFTWIQKTARLLLPNVRAIYFEPGRSLTQEGEILVSRVLDVRKSDAQRVDEVVVDACIAELPMIGYYSHRIFFQSQTQKEEFIPVTKGKARVLGRICMENDILSSGLEIPPSVEVGDFLIFADAGAYGRSMSYDFGRG